MEQQSREWFIARMGIITGSCFIRATGSNRVKNTYIKELIRERELLAGNQADLDAYLDKVMGVRAASLNWGNKHEPYAISAFELEYDMDVTKSGFILHPDYPFIGVSLDGFVHDNDSHAFAIAEVKCPYDQKVHQETLMLGMPDKHGPQVHGNAWVAHMNIGYFISFDPRAELENRLYVQAVDIDQKYIGKLEESCVELYECVEAGKELKPPKAVTLF